MRRQIEHLLATQQFDCVVCDFLFPAANIPDLSGSVLFQHNVEATIWQRHADKATNAMASAYFALQARHMRAYEQTICRSVKKVVAVSEHDRETMQSEYQVKSIDSVRTGVSLSYFTPPEKQDRTADLVFVGSMDWLPNIDGAKFFLETVFPRIVRHMPECRVAFVGRNPEPWLVQASKSMPNVVVSGTVPDVRPWLWGSAVSLVPLRIGGGTRLKIFEAMASQVPVVSTTIGAEGLPVVNDTHLLIEDDPGKFAEACLFLLNNPSRRKQLALEAWQLVASRFSWEAVAAEFEQILAAPVLTEVGA
jgi:glycosyltransferase involved in cell wall biosynthesis